MLYNHNHTAAVRCFIFYTIIDFFISYLIYVSISARYKKLINKYQLSNVFHQNFINSIFLQSLELLLISKNFILYRVKIARMNIYITVNTEFQLHSAGHG